MSVSLEVKIGGRGTVRDGKAVPDPAAVAHCDLCGKDVDAVASASAAGGSPYACKDCLRQRLEAMTLGAWMLRGKEDGALPWGKVSG